jgi:hypothetical protein
VPFFDDLIRPPPVLIQKGYITIPKPGWASSDEQVAYKYRKPGEKFLTVSPRRLAKIAKAGQKMRALWPEVGVRGHGLTDPGIHIFI